LRQKIEIKIEQERGKRKLGNAQKPKVFGGAGNEVSVHAENVGKQNR